MERLSDLLLLLLLVTTLTRAQENGAGDTTTGEDTPDGDDNPDGADDAAGKAAEECDEAWEYIEFLKNDVQKPATDIATLYKKATDIDATISSTMQNVMQIRESILARIKDLRKGEKCINKGQNIKQADVLADLRMQIMTILLKLVDSDAASIDSLQEIGSDLVQFSSLVNKEIIRIFMIPDNVVAPVEACDCGIVTTMKGKLETLINCAEDNDNSADKDVVDGPDNIDAAVCVEPIMYNMEMITLMQEIDVAISNLYKNLISEKEKDVRFDLFDRLRGLKDIRKQLDDITSKLLKEEDPEKLKRVITRNTRRVLSEVQSQLSNCLSKCGGSEDCDSCGSLIISRSIDKMEEYQQYLADQNRDEDEKRDFVRGDLIKLINEYNEESRAILTKRASAEELDTCDTQKYEIFILIKGPMWMLVNTTIFSDIGEVDVMVDTMINQLKQILPGYCGSKVTTTPKEGPNCQWAEYENYRDFILPEVDNVIQTSIFKAKKDSDKKEAIKGLISVQRLFDDRIKKLFEDRLVCPNEVTAIKKTYMGQLNQCMDEFLDSNVKFTQMTRKQRISCIKVLRGSIESRSTKLLQYELERSLNDISQQNEIN